MLMHDIIMIILLIISLILLNLHKNKACMAMLLVGLCIYAVNRLSDAVPMCLIMKSGIMELSEIIPLVIIDLLSVFLLILSVIFVYRHKSKAAVWCMAILLFMFLAGNWNTWLELIFRLKSALK